MLLMLSSLVRQYVLLHHLTRILIIILSTLKSACSGKHTFTTSIKRIWYHLKSCRKHHLLYHFLNVSYFFNNPNLYISTKWFFKLPIIWEYITSSNNLLKRSMTLYFYLYTKSSNLVQNALNTWTVTVSLRTPYTCIKDTCYSISSGSDHESNCRVPWYLSQGTSPVSL